MEIWFEEEGFRDTALALKHIRPNLYNGLTTEEIVQYLKDTATHYVNCVNYETPQVVQSAGWQLNLHLREDRYDVYASIWPYSVIEQCNTSSTH